MYIPFILAVGLYLFIYLKTNAVSGAKALAILLFATFIGLIFSIFGGFLFPALAITLATRNDYIWAVGFQFFGALLGVFSGYLIPPFGEWLGKVSEVRRR